MNCNFSVTFIKSLNQSSIKSCLKLPKLKITAFMGNPSDWVRFENMFVKQVHSRPISDGDKFGYLSERVLPKVREQISNLKPGTLGYRTAWKILQREYGQTKVAVNSRMDEIMNLSLVNGYSYDEVRESYEKLNQHFDALIPWERLAY